MLYENETLEKPINSGFSPIINAPDIKPSPSPFARGGKGNNKGKMCHNNCYIYMLLVESCDRHSEIYIPLFPQLVYASP